MLIYDCTRVIGMHHAVSSVISRVEVVLVSFSFVLTVLTSSGRTNIRFSSLKSLNLVKRKKTLSNQSNRKKRLKTFSPRTHDASEEGCPPVSAW